MQEAQGLAGLHRFQIRPFASNLGFLNRPFVMETFHSAEDRRGGQSRVSSRGQGLGSDAGKQLMPLNHLLPSSPKARPHLGRSEGHRGCCLHREELGAAQGSRAKFGAEQSVMWFLVFISTNARMCCPAGLFLLNENCLKKQTSAKPTALCYMGGQGELFTSFPAAYRFICGLVSPTLLRYIQSQFWPPSFGSHRSKPPKAMHLLGCMRLSEKPW